MVQVSYPGVYVQEVPSGVRTITGVSTSIAAFIGLVLRGPLNKPTTVLSFADYQRAFGDDTTASEMTDQVRQFFLNGGQQAIILRIADAASVATATVSLEAETGETVLAVQAKEAGSIGNQLRMEVTYATPNPESTFNLRVFREVVNQGVVQVDAEEVLQGLSMDPADPNFVESIVNQTSTLIGVTVPTSGLPALINGYSRSALLVDATSVATAASQLSALVATNNVITIRVDGGPPLGVALPALAGAGATLDDRLQTWEDAINNLAGASAVTVTAFPFPGGASLVQVQITSQTSGGSIVVTPGAGGDATQSLQLGVGQGGVEVGGYAPRRPALTGHFAVLGADLARLNSFAGTDPADFTTWTLTDSSGDTYGAVSITFTGSFLYSGAFTPAGFAGSLRNARQNLQLLADSIADNTNDNWTTALQGYRLVLTPTFGTVNSDTSAQLTSGATFDIGDTGQMFDGSTNVRAYSVGPGGGGAFQVAGATGNDGTSEPQLTDYEEAFAILDREIDLFNLLLLPKTTQQGFVDNRDDVWGPASSFCLSRRAFLIADAPSTGVDAWSSVATVVAEVDDFRIGLVKDHTGLYWPPVEVPNTNGTTRSIDPSGSVAGIMARIDANRGVFKAPAGIEADVRGIRGVKIRISDAENGLINPKAVNAIRVFPNGIVAWGARTLDGFDNSGNNDYKYVPVRRLALFIEESLVRGLKFAVFEPNDEPLWAQIRLAAGAFMNNLFRQGAFQGRKQSDAFFVKVDSETTTQNDINLGIVNVVVGFAPLKPAEFIVITIQQKAGQVQV